MDARFTPRAPADIAKLVADQPLAWVVSRDFLATPLPLLAETDAAGSVVSLLGHFARRNPQVAALRLDPDALILLQGPHGYISPRLISNPTWAPTWNYAVVRFEVTIDFVPEETDAAVRRLAAHLERTEPRPWRIEQLGNRYGQLLPHIIAFRAQIRATHARFKLGQDENTATFHEIVAGLGHSPLAELMSGQATTS
jgi:transcriptional regulator